MMARNQEATPGTKGLVSGRRAYSQSRAARHRFRSSVEALEERRLLATFQWAGNSDGDFGVAANWQDQNNQPGVPGPNDDAIIGFSGITVTVAASAAVSSLKSSARVNVSSGTLSLANVASNSQ